MSDVRIVLSHARAVCAVLDNAWIWSWRGALGSEEWEDLRLRRVAHAHRHPEGSATVVLIAESAPIPTDEVRALIARIRRDATPEGMRGAAIICDGDAMRRSILRSVTTSVSSLVREGYPQSFFATTTEAAAWVHARLGDAAPPLSRLAASIVAVRDHQAA